MKKTDGRDIKTSPLMTFICFCFSVTVNVMADQEHVMLSPHSSPADAPHSESGTMLSPHSNPAAALPSESGTLLPPQSNRKNRSNAWAHFIVEHG